MNEMNDEISLSHKKPKQYHEDDHFSVPDFIKKMSLDDIVLVKELYIEGLCEDDDIEMICKELTEDN